MYIVNRRKNIRLIGCEYHITDEVTFIIYKVQIKYPAMDNPQTTANIIFRIISGKNTKTNAIMMEMVNPTTKNNQPNSPYTTPNSV